MANRRMFSKVVTDSDIFLDLPLTAQCLYFHLGMAADDDGFVNSPKRIVRCIGCRDDDLKALADSGLIIRFKNGVIVITDWKRNNEIKTDRRRATCCQEEKNCLRENNKRYEIVEECKSYIL